MMRVRASRRAFAAVATAATVALGLVSTSMAGATTPTYKVGGLGEAVAGFFFTPGYVPGVNVWTCKPSAEHPNPVVLVHGTFLPLGTTWVKIGPTLANQGYCVYAFNYGYQWWTDPFYGMAAIEKGADTLKSFVSKVRTSTGASKVDLVGYSQGSLVSRYYEKRLGGAANVRRDIHLSGDNHGTTNGGLVDLGEALGTLGFIDWFLGLTAPALSQQIRGSSFLTALNADGDTAAGVQYVTLNNTADDVVTPYTSGLLTGPNVRNVILQDQCPTDNPSHTVIYLDGPMTQNIVNALGVNDPNFKATCTDFAPQ